MSRLLLVVLPALILAPLQGCSSDLEQQVANLESANPMVRLEAAKLAKRDNDPRIAAALTPLLNDSSKEIRLTAADSLTYIAGEDEVPALAGALADSDREVRLAAVNALGRIQDERAVVPLLKLLQSEHEPYSIIWALGNIGSSQSLDALTPMLDHEDRYTRYQARRALLKIR
jgi:HEAT repeat protein